MSNDPLTPAQLDALRRLGTCAVANAIEAFEVRLRNTGFADATIHCAFDDLPPAVGYAATARVRTSVPPMVGHRYVDRTDWWNSILSVPAPRIVVIEDVDRHPGLGALVGGVHGNILRALGCTALMTNGAVRDLPQLHAIGLQAFAGQVAVSHAYAHIFEFGEPVEVGGLRIEPGDLLHGDRHGLLKVPMPIADRIPSVAQAMAAHDNKIIALCQSQDFSIERLRVLLGAGPTPQVSGSAASDPDSGSHS